jgi:hypothetical protein
MDEEDDLDVTNIALTLAVTPAQCAKLAFLIQMPDWQCQGFNSKKKASAYYSRCREGSCLQDVH